MLARHEPDDLHHPRLARVLCRSGGVAAGLRRDSILDEEDYRLTVDQRHSLLERSLAETRDAHEFYVALYAEKHKWNDLTATEPARDDLFPPDADALEPYCTQCGVRAGVFIARGTDWRHYTGDPGKGSALPFDADHAPVIVELAMPV